MKEAKRLHPIKEYYFSTKLTEINQLKSEGKSIINLGIGSPDISPDPIVLKKMMEITSQSNSHGYQSYRGHPEFKKAIAQFYKKHFGVKLKPKTQILPLHGSKEGIMHISMAFLNKGDHVLIPNPGYLTYRSATLLAGGIPIEYQLKSKNNWFPNLKELEKRDLTKVKIMWINYPHMPTGAIAGAKEFKKIIQFAKKHKILVINDNPYSFIRNHERISILKFDDTFEYVMELNSLSKSHNMAGWRVGMLLGKKQYIDTVLKFKSNMDSGMYLATQLAASKALNLPDKWYQELNKTYRNREKIAEKIFEILNISFKKNQAGLFLWGKLPKGFHSKQFTDNLLDKTGIFLAPGFIFGSQGKRYVRLSLTNSIQELKEALKRIEKNQEKIL